MIDIEKTISLRGYDPLMLKPKSNKRVWCICNECGAGRWVIYFQYSDLCHKCASVRWHISEKTKPNPKPDYVAEKDRFISNTVIDRITTIKEKGYDPINLKPNSQMKVWVICENCGEGRWSIR